MIDCVWMLGTGSKFDDWEIRYSMRSAYKNVKDGGQFWIVGHCPDFIDRKQVRVLDHPDPYESNKDGNLIGKAIRVSLEPDLTRDFILFSDDQFVVRESLFEDFYPYCSGNLKNYRWSKDDVGWRKRQYHTFEFLLKHKKSTWSCECHIPYPCRKDLFPRLLETNFGFEKGYVIFTLYYNWIHLSEMGISEPLDISDDQIRGALVGSSSLASGIKKFENCRFVSFNHATLRNWYMAAILEKMFPEPAPWEKDGGGNSLVKDSDLIESVQTLEKRTADMELEKIFYDNLMSDKGIMAKPVF